MLRSVWNRCFLILQGRQFPVEVFYTESPEQDYIDAALMAILQIHQNEAPGDVLVFLTGQDEIESMRQLISDRRAPMLFLILRFNSDSLLGVLKGSYFRFLGHFEIFILVSPQ